MTAHGRPILEAVLAQDDALAAKGWPRLTPWWREQLTAFYDSTRFSFAARVGRQGTKSSTMERIAAATGVFVDHKIQPGRRGTVAFVSVRLSEADERLYGIRAILDALRVKHRPGPDGGIELLDRPIIFRTYPASFRTAVGFTGVALFADEVARWRDADSGANPAREVNASMVPGLVTQDLARAYYVSSPLGTDDFHAEVMDRGTTSSAYACEAPSWVANPSITEERTRELEPDDRKWRREYAAVPQAGALGAFDEDAVNRAFGVRCGEEPASRYLVIDASSGRKDTWTWGVCGWIDRSPAPPLLRFLTLDGISGSFWQQTSGADVVARIATAAKARGVTTVFADQREAMMLQSEFNRNDLSFRVFDWTASSKPPAVERVRRWLAEGQIMLPEHETARRELLAFEERITASGQFTFGARGSGHDDYVALLITAAMADLDGAMDRGGSAFDFALGPSWLDGGYDPTKPAITGADRDARNRFEDQRGSLGEDPFGRRPFG